MPTFGQTKLYVFNEEGEMLEVCKNIPVSEHFVSVLYDNGCYVEDFHYKRYSKEELLSKCQQLYKYS